MSKLDGKITVITGGSSGIGLAAAKKFVEEGAYVFIAGRRQSELDKAKAEIGSNVTAVQADAANLADLDRLYRTVKDEKGALDIVVASAGVVERVLTQDATPEHFDKTFGINARGVYFTVQKALPLMRKGGSIVLVSSGLHLKGLPEHGTYAATKAAVRSFARTWAMELKDRGIRVNTLSPGAIDTPIIDGQFKSKKEADGARAFFSSITPLGRIGRPEEMAVPGIQRQQLLHRHRSRCRRRDHAGLDRPVPVEPDAPVALVLNGQARWRPPWQTSGYTLSGRSA
jgi:NAD(P)-dependent dehydrogenase (short-subunit alcohol dehydrogenase family)